MITDFQIFNRSAPLTRSITETSELVLSYKDRVFSFEFAALDFTIPARNQYAYRMEGFDREWNYIGARRIATYTNLPGGTYTFRVKGSNNDGIWNEEGRAIHLTIVPPFWKTVWFTILLAACGIGAGYAGHKLRIRHIKKDQERLERDVRERTKELVEKNRQIRQQQQLVESEKMAALGQLIAGIAHEINTPIGAIRASIGNIFHALNDMTRQLAPLFQNLSPEQQTEFFALVDRALHDKKQLTSREERSLRRALQDELETYTITNADSMADMLVDMGIYENIAPFVPLFQHEEKGRILQVAYNMAAQHHHGENMKTAIERVSKILFALKSYARYDESGEMSETNIAENIDIVLTLYRNQLKQGIEVIQHYDDLPALRCYPDQLTQVWTNLIHNAIQAMAGRGTLEITVSGQQPAAGSDQHPAPSPSSSKLRIPAAGFPTRSKTASSSRSSRQSPPAKGVDWDWILSGKSLTGIRAGSA